MVIGLLTLHFHIPGCISLKQKRGMIKPVLARLHREFNISANEVGALDAWQESVIACTLASCDAPNAQRTLQGVVEFVIRTWPDLDLVEHHLQLV